MSEAQLQDQEQLRVDSNSHRFIELAGVHKSFNGVPVLEGVDLSVARGEVLTILGGSGSGKSVMLKHMIGLLQPDAGSVFVEGRDVTRFSEREWFEVRRRIGYVFQGSALFDSISVYENVAYPLREHLRLREDEVAEQVESCLESVGLEGVGPMMPSELSGGMRKRVAVARAIALQPQAIFYDEPTTGLDPANSRRIGQLILRLQAELNVTSIVVTHEIELCFSVSDRIVLLDRGQLQVEATVAEFRTSTAPEVLAFLGESDGRRESDPEAREGESHAG
ncbi:MAG: ABC transporter ATP-binding protein [Myxococcales bacterium]|nr:ABC transporter ATP-binding protein [Myxococcales bacterium]